MDKAHPEVAAEDVDEWAALWPPDQTASASARNVATRSRTSPDSPAIKGNVRSAER